MQINVSCRYFKRNWVADFLGVFLAAGGVKYVGEVKDGQKHGYGVLIRPCGSKYEGYFRNGVADGEGTFVNPAGEQDAAN